LLLLPRVQVVGSPDHDGVYATRAARLALDAGLEQLQVRLRPDIRLPSTKKREQRAPQPSDGRIGCFLPEEVSNFGRVRSQKAETKKGVSFKITELAEAKHLR
jgi:hypothetical protein